MKRIYGLFGIKHIHCYSEKNRHGTMVCHICGKEQPERG